VARPHLIRPFLGTGVLGGFTTFSTYEGDIDGWLPVHMWARRSST
jgi:CrcB protein